MKLELKNFKCWTNNTFEIPDKGIVLLSAESGTGKSSLLDAIAWVLFGNIKSTLSLGATTGHVKLWYEDMYILRSKRPNRLVLKYKNKEYEDDSAQYKIEELFGTNFEIVSYIKQDNTNSFCRISPSEKTDFIEKSIFHNTDVKLMKSRVKDLVKEREMKLVELQSRLSVMEKFQVEKPVLTRFPIACDQSKYEETVTKYNKLFDNVETKRLELEKDISYNRIDRTSKEIEAEITEKQKHIDYFTEEITLKNHELTDMSFDESVYQNLIQIKKNIERFREKCVLERELQSISQTIKENEEQAWKEQEKIKKKLSDIPDNVHEEFETIEEYLKTHKQREKVSEQLSDLKNVTQELINTLKKEQDEYDLKNGVEVNCPSCNSDLVYLKTRLHKRSSSVKSATDKRKDIEKYEKKLIKKNMLEKEYTELTEQYDEWHEQSDIEDHLKELQDKIQLKKELEYRLSQETNLSSNKKLLKKQQELQTDLRRYADITEIKNIDENEIITQIADIELKKQTVNRLNNDIKSLTNKKAGLENEIGCLENKLDKAVKKETVIDRCKLEHKELTEKKDKYQKILTQIEKWRKSVEEVNKWEKYRNELSFVKSETDVVKEKLESVYTIKSKIIEAESICTSNFINVLNTHTQAYTDSFFKQNTILVNLQRQKVSKKGNEKPQLNITVSYKGNETDMSILSGGEKDRIDLAFTLALSEIFKSKVLLLDECISSLDHSNSENVIEGLRELYKGKLVVVVAHQVNEGLFDHVVKLN
jgi:DNA repair exonuclease SbcCD ATPase subunit